MINIKGKSIILFDGVCNLCNSSVQFIIKHDKQERYLFASLQSDAAKEILLHFNLKKNNIDSIFLIKNSKIYTKSTAALKIAKHLNNGFSLCYFFIIIPYFIRDLAYDYIAKNRYKWFGKQNECMLPSAKHKKRFIAP